MPRTKVGRATSRQIKNHKKRQTVAQKTCSQRKCPNLLPVVTIRTGHNDLGARIPSEYLIAMIRVGQWGQIVSTLSSRRASRETSISIHITAYERCSTILHTFVDDVALK